jgi:predicted nucleotidyltransferase
MRIVNLIAGSHLYGTNVETSDYDYKFVFLPGRDQILLQQCPEAVNTKVSETMEEEGFALHKYFKLLSSGQPIALEMLFAPKYTCEHTDVWEQSRKNKDKLLSKNIAGFIGYCRAQASKYSVKGERMQVVQNLIALINKNYKKNIDPFSCMEADLEQFCKDNPYSELRNIETTPGRLVRHLFVCNRGAALTQSMKEVHDNYTKLWNEYGKRAEAAKNMQGADWKALMHAVRVGQEAFTLLTYGELMFPLPDAKLLLAIRKGEWAYDKVAEGIEDLMYKVEEAQLKSKLPAQPDHKWINDFICEVYSNVVNGKV